jgi:hypothetical protein
VLKPHVSNTSATPRQMSRSSMMYALNGFRQAPARFLCSAVGGWSQHGAVLRTRAARRYFTVPCCRISGAISLTGYRISKADPRINYARRERTKDHTHGSWVST